MVRFHSGVLAGLAVVGLAGSAVAQGYTVAYDNPQGGQAAAPPTLLTPPTGAGLWR